MSEFRLTIRTSGAAFTDEYGGGERFDRYARDRELVRLLRDAASRIEAGELSHHTESLFDYNGNRVGGFVHTEDD